MAKRFSIMKSHLPNSSNFKPIIQQKKKSLLIIINCKVIHIFGSIQIYKNQQEKLTTKMF